MMRLCHVGVTFLAAGTMACPGPDLLGNGGLNIGHSGPGTSELLAFRVQPSSVTAGSIMTPAVQIQVQDTLGHVDSSFTASVIVVIGTNPLGGSLSGTTSVAPVNGVALFGNLIIDKAGTGYTLTASALGATGATSVPFDVIATTP